MTQPKLYIYENLIIDRALEICDDIREECVKFGTILDLKIPRPVGGSRQSAGVGKIFIKFDSTESSTNAMKALAGRKFSDRTVVTTYFPEVSPSSSKSRAYNRPLNTRCRKTSKSVLGKGS